MGEIGSGEDPCEESLRGVIVDIFEVEGEVETENPFCLTSFPLDSSSFFSLFFLSNPSEDELDSSRDVIILYKFGLTLFVLLSSIVRSSFLFLSALRSFSNSSILL